MADLGKKRRFLGKKAGKKKKDLHFRESFCNFVDVILGYEYTPIQ
jgi:hypothetical protein